MSSNIAQNYPYGSETEAERAATVAATIAAHEGLAERIAAEALPLDEAERWWTWHCPVKGCGGVLHAAGYARERRAVYAACELCGTTFLR